MTETTIQSPVGDLAGRFWEWFLAHHPTYATVLGDERYDDQLPDPSADGRAREVAALERFLAESRAITRERLEPEDRITLDMLEVVARIQLRQHEHRVHHIDAMDAVAGPQTLPAELSRYQRLDTPERLGRLLRRLEAYPAFLAAHRANVEEGVQAGRTAARPVFARVLEQTRRLVATRAIEAPLVQSNPGLDEPSRACLIDALERHVQPALADYLAALERYAKHTREGDGLWALPDGDALYETMILAWTTVEATPRELHDYGRAQLDEIRHEQKIVARELGDPDVASLRRRLETDRSNAFADRDEIVRRAQAQIHKANDVAPRFFGRFPRADCHVRPIESFQEAEAPPAFYLPPAPDGSRPGVYYVNTYQPESRPVHRLAAATYHEAVPGHHFQIAIEMELEYLPPFRRFGARLVGSAYAEGWGLYAERLADEMGLYEDARERLGMLDAQAWRAARLVVDTGLHAFRWSRQRSIELLREIGLSELEAETETDRYITWPGQALSYMTGQREIQDLRRQLERRDGERFELRAFHDALLAHGSLPLATLRGELPGWVQPRR